MTPSREDILRRIDQARLGMSVAVPERTYDTNLSLTREELVDLLQERILDYKATFTRTRDVPATIASLLTKYELRTVVIPHGLPADWAKGIIDANLSSSDLDNIDAVITSSEVSIAVTGTIVLNHSKANQGRRAISLVPDTHICVVAVDSVVGTVVEAVRQLNPRDHQTWISGPSATSDIELERVEGVHGPRNLHVILALN